MAIGRIPEPGTGIPESIVDAKGDIVTATAADTPARLAVGTNEQRLVADSAEATGLKYVADTTNYAIAAKGDLLVGTAADTLAVLSVGTNGHTLVADSSTATGLAYAAPASGGGMTLLQTNTLSGASYTTASISGDYKHLLLLLRDVNSSGADIIRYRFNSDTSGNYYYGGLLVGQNTAFDYYDEQAVTNVHFIYANESGNSLANGIINLYRYTDTDRIFFDFGSTAYSTALNPDLGRQTFTGTGIYDNSAAITTVTIFTNTGNVSGTMYVYGVS